MAELDKLQRELDQQKGDAEVQRRVQELPTLGLRPARPAPVAAVRAVDRLARVAQRSAAQHRRRLILLSSIGGGIVVIALAVAGTWWYRTWQTVRQNQIAVQLVGPSSITSGDTVTYEVHMQNNSRVPWDTVELSVTVPEGWRLQQADPGFVTSGPVQLLKVGTLEPAAEKIVRLTGQLIGEEQTTALAKTELTLTPRNFPSGRFSKVETLGTLIAAVPLEVSIDAPKGAAGGDRVAATITVRNTGSLPLEVVYVGLQVDEGLSLAPDDKEFSADFSVPTSRWKSFRLEPLQTISRQAVVYVNGSPGERRQLTAVAGLLEGTTPRPQRTVSHVLVVDQASLAVSQKFDVAGDGGIVATEQTVKGTVSYQNLEPVAFNDARITVHLEGIGFDPASLELHGGGYNAKTQTIIWTAAAVPELKVLQPHQKGEIKFEFAILKAEQFPKTGDQLNNFALVSTATADSEVKTGKVVASDRRVLSIVTDPTMEFTSFYDDGRLGIKSTGPNPPVVGQETTYTVRLRLGSSLNDMGEVTVRAVVPDGVRATGKTYKTSGEATFNDRAQEMVWQLPLVTGGTGRLSPAEELQFQVAVTPGAHQKNQQVPLLKSVSVTGVDQFTDTTVESKPEQTLLLLPKTDNVR